MGYSACEQMRVHVVDAPRKRLTNENILFVSHDSMDSATLRDAGLTIRRQQSLLEGIRKRFRMHGVETRSQIQRNNYHKLSILAITASKTAS